MMKRYMLAALTTGALIPLAGCIDKNYDLSDLDTSMEIPVNDLAIPLNVGPVVLDNIIDLKDSDCFDEEDYKGDDPALKGKKIYVYHYEGDFDSDPIHINSFSVKAPSDIESSEVEVVLSGMPTAKPGRRAISDGIVYDIKHVEKTFTYNINDVDDKVKDVTEVETPSVTFSIDLVFPYDVYDNAEEIRLSDVSIEFPEGLAMKDGRHAQALVNSQASIATYNPSDGIVTINDYTMKSRTLRLTLEAQVINVHEVGAILSNGHFKYDGHITVLGGKMEMKPKAGHIPSERFMVATDYELSSFEIENFSGTVDYDIEGLSFDAIDLNSMPDFLSKPGTAIRLADPQLYISFNNTCAPYGLGGLTSLDVTSYRDGNVTQNLVMEDAIVVGSNDGIGPYKFAISPQGDKLQINNPEYIGATKLMFSKFGDVLYSPEGIPTSVDVEFATPMVLGKAKKFPLKITGEPEDKWKIDPVHGSYQFRAPLALENDSKIYYSDTQEDFDTDILDDLYVNRMVVEASALSEIPLDVALSAKLYDKDKNAIGFCRPVTIPYGEQTDFKLEVTAYPDPENPEPDKFMERIDGIEYSVTAISNDENAVSLSPQQTITLDNFKIRVNGKYVSLDGDDDDEDYGYNK